MRVIFFSALKTRVSVHHSGIVHIIMSDKNNKYIFPEMH